VVDILSAFDWHAYLHMVLHHRWRWTGTFKYTHLLTYLHCDNGV